MLSRPSLRILQNRDRPSDACSSLRVHGDSEAMVIEIAWVEEMLVMLLHEKVLR